MASTRDSITLPLFVKKEGCGRRVMVRFGARTEQSPPERGGRQMGAVAGASFGRCSEEVFYEKITLAALCSPGEGRVGLEGVGIGHTGHVINDVGKAGFSGGGFLRRGVEDGGNFRAERVVGILYPEQEELQ